MKSEVEGNTRHIHTCCSFFCFFTRAHRLICLSFPPSFKHLSSSSPFVWYQHIWRYKKNCTEWWVSSWFHWYIEITVNLIYILSGFSLIFFFFTALNFTTTLECPSDGTVPITSGCWRLANVFCEAHEVIPLIYRQLNTHTRPSTELPETYCFIAVEAKGAITDVHLHFLNYCSAFPDMRSVLSLFQPLNPEALRRSISV